MLSKMLRDVSVVVLEHGRIHPFPAMCCQATVVVLFLSSHHVHKTQVLSVYFQAVLAKFVAEIQAPRGGYI